MEIFHISIIHMHHVAKAGHITYTYKLNIFIKISQPSSGWFVQFGTIRMLMEPGQLLDFPNQMRDTI